MKTNITNPFTCLGVASMRSRVLPALIAGLCLIPAGRVTAQTEALILTKPESLLSSVSLQGRFSDHGCVPILLTKPVANIAVMKAEIRQPTAIPRGWLRQ